MGARSYTLLANQAVDSAATTISPGGYHMWFAKATWGGNSLKLQILMPDAATYADIQGAVMDVDGAMSVWLPNGANVKAVRNGAPTAIYSTLVSGGQL